MFKFLKEVFKKILEKRGSCFVLIADLLLWAIAPKMFGYTAISLITFVLSLAVGVISIGLCVMLPNVFLNELPFLLDFARIFLAALKNSNPEAINYIYEWAKQIDPYVNIGIMLVCFYIYLKYGRGPKK